MKGIIMESEMEDRTRIIRRFVIPWNASVLDLERTVTEIMWGGGLGDGFGVATENVDEMELVRKRNMEAPLNRLPGCRFGVVHPSDHGILCNVRRVGCTDRCNPYSAELIESEGDVPLELVSPDAGNLSDMVNVNDRLVRTGIMGSPVHGWRRIGMEKRVQIIEAVFRFDALALFFEWETGDIIRVDDPETSDGMGVPFPDVSMDDIDPRDPAYSFICSPSEVLISVLDEVLSDNPAADIPGKDGLPPIELVDPSIQSEFCRRLHQRVMEVPMEWARANRVSFVWDADVGDGGDGTWNDVCGRICRISHI